MGGRRFLVADDEDLIVDRFLIPLVRPFGEVDVARDGAQAIGIIQAAPAAFTAIVADLCMPGASGLEVLAHARARWPCVPAMLVSGRCDDDAVNAVFDYRVEFIAKPVESGRVRRFIMEAISKSDAGAFPARVAAIVASRRRLYRLSEAEGDILERSARGETREEIALARGVKLDTVNKQATSLLRKVGERSFRHAVERAVREASGVAGDSQK